MRRQTAPSSKNWMLTRSGGVYAFENPDPRVVVIEDVAHALAMQVRYVGHVDRFYSVAEHSCRVSDLVAQQFGDSYALEGLMHDSPEAYLGDVSRYLKKLLPDYRRLERVSARVLARKFGFPEEKTPEVDWADKTLYRTERRDLFMENLPLHPDNQQYQPLVQLITPWSWERAEIEFMMRYRRITNGM